MDERVATKSRFRWLGTRLPTADQRRIAVLTGARQTGKTTLVRALFPDLRYINFDAVEAREAVRGTRTAAWARTVGRAILDEAQKEPSIFEKVKYAFDAREIDFTVLLGSSRFLLLEQIRESLAGRAFLYDLWPLMLSELAAAPGEEPPRPLFDALLGAEGTIDSILEEQPQVLFGAEEERRRAALDHLEAWGGMPGLLELSDEDRRDWLRSYRQTFLERDLSDLVRLRELHPFRALQELAMLRTGQFLNFADLARDAGMAPSTARNYLEYLDIAYQVIFVRPYHRNLTSTLVKAPKLYWVDIGLIRQGTNQWGRLDGAQFETLVAMECHKWIRTMAPDVGLYSYRTRSRREVDLLVETSAGVFGIEVKGRAEASPSDARTMKALASELGERWLGGLVVHRGAHLRPLVPEASVWEVPVQRLFT